MNGHTIGFHQQTQKLELHYVSPLLPLGGKGLIGLNCSVVKSKLLCLVYASVLFFLICKWNKVQRLARLSILTWICFATGQKQA